WCRHRAGARRRSRWGLWRAKAPLDRHGPSLVRATDRRRVLAVAGGGAHPFGRPSPDVPRWGPPQKGDAGPATGGKYPLARLLHGRRIGMAWQAEITERQPEVTGSHLRKADARHGEDLFASRHAFRTFNLEAKQQLALRVERPGIAAFHVLL